MNRILLLLCLPTLACAFTGLPSNVHAMKNTGRLVQRSVVTCHLRPDDSFGRPLNSKANRGLPLRMKFDDEDKFDPMRNDMDLVPVSNRGKKRGNCFLFFLIWSMALFPSTPWFHATVCKDSWPLGILAFRYHFFLGWEQPGRLSALWLTFTCKATKKLARKSLSVPAQWAWHVENKTTRHCLVSCLGYPSKEHARMTQYILCNLKYRISFAKTY